MPCTQCDKPTEPIATTGARFFLSETATLPEYALACTACDLVYCGTCALDYAVGLDEPDVQVHLCPACNGLLSLYEA